MNIAITYNYPAEAGPEHTEYALRFIESYHNNPPVLPHSTVVVLNDAKATTEVRMLFASLPKVTFLERKGVAMDIGGYQEAAQKYPADLMVFFGGSSYVKGRGWLQRMTQAFIKHGNQHLYGCMGNRGDNRVRVWPHIRTTGFWCSAEAMNQYPHRITANDKRYEFEHGKTGFTTWFYEQKRKVFVVTWHGEYEWKDWDDAPNGFHRGNQSALLAGDRLTCSPYWHTP